MVRTASSAENIGKTTATSRRRHRPSTKEQEPEVEAKTEKRGSRKVTAKTAKPATAKRTAKEKPTTRREDKREAPEEMETKARPKNLSGDTNDKKNKGQSTYRLESTEPGKRPSRKSTRGGANHAKPDSQQRRQTTRAVRSAKARKDMRGG